jgi:hypothetical protein
MKNKLGLPDYIYEEADEEAIHRFCEMVKRIDMYAAKQFKKEKIDPQSCKHLCALMNILTLNIAWTHEHIGMPIELLINFCFEIMSTSINNHLGDKVSLKVAHTIQEQIKETNVPNSLGLH